jgi:hypothetical protein
MYYEDCFLLVATSACTAHNHTASQIHSTPHQQDYHSMTTHYYTPSFHSFLSSSFIMLEDDANARRKIQQMRKKKPLPAG